MQGTAMQGASIQGGGQPGGFSPGQNQVTPQDHEKVSNAVCLHMHKSFGFLSSQLPCGGPGS